MNTLIDITPRLSRKMSALYFFAIIWVAVIHCATVSETSAVWNIFLQRVLTEGFAGWAVPFFFISSGFWLGRSAASVWGAEVFSWWLGVLRKKSRTLLIPYILWSIIGCCVIMPLVCGNNLLMHRGNVFIRTPFENSSFWDVVNAIFGIWGCAPWGEGVLWFVRVLFLFIFTIPFWLLVKRISFVLLIMIGIYSALRFPSIFGFQLDTSLGWCITGFALAGRCEKYLEVKSSNVIRLIPFAILFLAVSIAIGACKAHIVEDEVIWNISRISIPILGIPTIWMAYDIIIGDVCNMPIAVGFTFWIFAMHQMLAGYLVAFCHYYFRENDIGLFLAWPIILAMVITLCVASGRFVEAKWPTVYMYLTGGRIRLPSA